MMWKHVRYTVRAAIGMNPAGRRLTVYPDDVFIVSYPRSGNTWARFLIGNLLHPADPITFANVERRVPTIYFFPDRKLRALPRPRLFKSHEYFDPRYGRTIYFVRDPRDVAVSVYYYSLKRIVIADSLSIDDFIPRFLRGEYFVDFGTWEEHVQSWYSTRRSKPGFLWVKYEDLLANPGDELGKIAAALQVRATAEAITRAVELSSAANMRSLEQKHASDWKLTRGTRQDIPFVRAATSGGWREKLSPASVQAIELAWGTTMQELGYPLVSQPHGERKLVKN